MKLVLQFQKKDFKWLRKLLGGAVRRMEKDAESLIQTWAEKSGANESPEKFFLWVSKVREWTPHQFHGPIMDYLEGMKMKFAEKWAAASGERSPYGNRS